MQGHKKPSGHVSGYCTQKKVLIVNFLLGVFTGLWCNSFVVAGIKTRLDLTEDWIASGRE